METQDVLAAIPGAPAAPTTESKQPDRLAAHKAAFAELLASSKANETPDIKAAQKAAEAVRAADKAEKAQPKQKVEAKAPQRDPEHEKLRTKLRLAGHPQKAIESLSDQEVREWWTLQEQRERDNAEVRERAAALQRATKGEATSQPEPDDGVPTGALDLDDIAEELKAQFGEDEAGALRRALETLMTPIVNRVHQLEGVIQKAQEKGKASIVESNRSRLSEKVPHLKDNDRAWSIVQSQVEAAFAKDPASYPSAEAAFDDFAQALFPDAYVEREAEPEEEKSEALKARIAAAAPTPPKSQKSTKKATPVDAAYMAFRVLDKDPDDLEGARRAFNRASLPQ
jgi:hypothetical protein